MANSEDGKTERCNVRNNTRFKEDDRVLFNAFVCTKRIKWEKASCYPKVSLEGCVCSVFVKVCV